MAIEYIRNRAFVGTTRPIDNASVGEIIDVIHFLREHCFYNRICLSISSGAASTGPLCVC